jgi:translocator protein
MLFFHKKRKISDALVLAIAIIIPQIAGFIGSLYTTPNISTWYSGITKPSFNPPNWIFGPVWTTLFLMMGVASFIIYKQKDKIKTQALKLYLAQLTLNIMWSVIFFGAKNPLGGFLVIVALWIEIAYTMDIFYKIKKTAGYLFVPYFLWVSFAMILNFSIYILN